MVAAATGALVSSPPHDLRSTFELVVVEKKPAAAGVVGVLLAAQNGGPLPQWEPGAHIDAVLPRGIERQYSLCSDPADQHRWRIAVSLEPDSRGGSRYIHEHLEPGDTVLIRGPRNNFPLVSADSYVFIAGGIGITPILPMVARSAMLGATWRLIYGGRSIGSMAFVDELARYGSQVVFWPQDRLGLIDLPAILASPSDGCRVYCCGPEALIAAAEQNSAHWPDGSFRYERFRSQPGATNGPDTPFDVYLAESGLTVHVDPGQTIADAVQVAGVDVLLSCGEGTCGTCETQVIDGVPDHRDSVLTPEERAANSTMMICCSRSLTPRLELDL